jgi:hypothetical protein
MKPRKKRKQKSLNCRLRRHWYLRGGCLSDTCTCRCHTKGMKFFLRKP